MLTRWVREDVSQLCLADRTFKFIDAGPYARCPFPAVPPSMVALRIQSGFDGGSRKGLQASFTFR